MGLHCILWADEQEQQSLSTIRVAGSNSSHILHRDGAISQSAALSSHRTGWQTKRYRPFETRMIKFIMLRVVIGVRVASGVVNFRCRVSAVVDSSVTAGYSTDTLATTGALRGV